MKLKSRLMIFTAALALSTGMAAAAITGKDVVKTYQDQSYTYIEVKEGPTQIKVEAIKGGNYIEVVYDKASGSVVSTESGVASAKDAAQTGVSVKTVKADFESDDDSSGDDDDINDGDDDDSNDDDNNDDSDDNDDDSGDDENDENDDDNNSGDDDHGGNDDDNGDDDNNDDDNSGSNGSGGGDDNSDCDD